MGKPSAGGIPAAIVKRLQTVRYAVGDVLFVVGRAAGSLWQLVVRLAVAAGGGIGGAWGSLSVIARRWLVAALGVAVLALVFFSAVVPNLPCQLPGGDSCPPGDDAAALVPAGVLAYLHANLDPDTDEYAAASDLAAKLPLFGAQIAARSLALIPSPGGTKLDFDRSLRPWFGGEAAIAVIGGSRAAPERVDLLEVSDSGGAADYVRELAVGNLETVEYEGVAVSTDQRDVASAQVSGFLVLGTEDGVRAVVATATGADGSASLADDPNATEIRDQLPDHHFAEAWVSPAGIADLIAADRGTLGTLTPLIAPGASRGVAASLSADDGELEFAVRSALDPERERASPSFFAAFPPFEPALPERLPGAGLAYLGIGAPEATVSALLGQASAEAPAIAAGFEDLARGLRRQGNVDLEGELLSSLGDEAAFALEAAPGQAAAGALPYLLFAADGVDEDAARKALAALQAPLADAVGHGDGSQGPVVGQDEVSGVQTASLQVSPTIALTYAVFDGLVAVATDPAGVAELAGGGGGSLGQEDRYADATAGFPDQVSLQAYLNLEGLVATAEQAGLAEDPLYATFAGDFRRLDALALAVDESDDVLATDARLLVGEPPAAAGEAAPAPPAGD